MTHLFAILATAWLIGWEALDAYVSRFYPLYVERETNELAQDTTGADAGYYEPAKSYALTGGVLAAGIILWIFLSPWSPVLVFIPMGTWIAIVVWKNFRVMRKDRAGQFSLLRSIKIDPLGYAAQIKPEHDFHHRPIWYVAPNFWDVRIPAVAPFDNLAERERAKEVLTAKMRRLAAKPESAWWKIGRADDI